jgi:hypothetical protein
MKKYLRFILISFLFGACKNKTLPIPAGILLPDTLSEIQAEFYLIEAANNMALIKQDTNHASYDDFYALILQKHRTRKSQIDSSLQFYAGHPEVLDSIFSKTMLILDKKEIEQRKKREKNP